MSRQGKRRPRDLSNVREFWNREAREWGDNPQVTVRDHYQRLLEIEIITDLLDGRRRALDIGCGSGFGTLFFADAVEEIVGEDYAEAMVHRARRFLEDPEYYEHVMERYAPDRRPKGRENVRFDVGNILELAHPDDSFDAVIAERVLINLPSREFQDQASREIRRVLAPGGRWILTEATEQGHRSIDELRTRFRLSPIEKYWHNLYLDEDHFVEDAAEAGFTVTEIQRFETYNFLTKILHPLVVAPDEPQFLSRFNDAARVVCREHFDHAAVVAAGFERFFTEVFRGELAAREPDTLTGYDAVAEKLVAEPVDFTGCSHHVLYVLDG